MSSAPAGLLASLRGFATTAVGLLRNRLALFSLETQEALGHISGLLMWGIAALWLALLGITFSAIFLTVLFWESHRLLALGLFAALFLSAAGVAVFVTLRLARQGVQLFVGTLAELRQDLAALHPDQAQDGPP